MNRTIGRREVVDEPRAPHWHAECPVDAMRKLLLSVLLVGLGTPILVAQNARAQQRFAGTWEAKLKDKVICTIKLEAADPISGTTHACNINVNSEGELIEPKTSDGKTNPILDPKIDRDTLSFAVKDEDGGESTKFELKLTGEGQAELRCLNPPVPIKPIHFAKK